MNNPTNNPQTNEERYVVIGLLAGGALLGFYALVSSILGGVSFAIENFVAWWYLMIPLVIGFGIQMGLFFYVKEHMHKKEAGSATVSAGVSGTAMVACCAHHVADIAPFLGIAAVGIFFTQYQLSFLLAGVFSNILGIIYMVSRMKGDAVQKKIQYLFYGLLAVSFFIVAVSAGYSSANGTSVTQSQSGFRTVTNTQNEVEFGVTPLSPSEFQISINTHSVPLDFDLMEVATLYDDTGRSYRPAAWDGSPPGGHHRSGTLRFSNLPKNTKNFKLVIIDSATREFAWTIS